MRRALALAAVALLAGCGGQGKQAVPPGSVAVVDGRVITQAALNEVLATARRKFAVRGSKFPARGTGAYRRLQDSAVRLLVSRAQLENAARRAGITITAAQVGTELRRFKQREFGGDEKRYRERLRRAGLSEGEIRAAFRTELLAHALRGKDRSTGKVTYAPGFEPSS